MRYALLCNRYAEFYFENLVKETEHKLVLFVSTNKQYIARYSACPGLTESALSKLSSLRVDAILVVAYGEKISPYALKRFRGKWFNLHFSLLPRLRGATPIESTILLGCITGGVTVIKMNELIDAGTIVLQSAITVSAQMSSVILEDVLLRRSLYVLRKFFKAIHIGKIEALCRNQSGMVTPSLTKKKLNRLRIIDSEAGVHEVQRLVYALSERGVYLSINSEKLMRILTIKSVFVSRELPFKEKYERYIGIYRGDVYFSFRGGAVVFGDVQMPGKKRMSVYQWSIGYKANDSDYRKLYRIA